MKRITNLDIDTVIKLPHSDLLTFFKRWFDFLQPIHKMANREITVAASLYKMRYLLSSMILDDYLLDTTVLRGEYKDKVIEETGLSKENFNVSLSVLRKLGILDGKTFNKRYVPKITKDKNSYKLLLVFDFDGEDFKTNSSSEEDTIERSREDI